MKTRAHVILLTALLFLLLGAVGSHAYFPDDPVTCYALLAVMMPDTNPAVFQNQDPIDLNTEIVTLSRVYAVLKDAGFEDSHMTVLYGDNGLEPDWSEKKNAKYIKMLKDKHFKNPNRDATKANVESAVTSLKQKLDANDQFVFYVACHGAANGNLLLGQRSQWTPADIQKVFTSLSSRTNYLLFEACYSGKILDNVTLDNAAMFSITGNNSPGWVDRTFSNAANFLEFKVDKKCDKNKDGVVDCEEAFEEAKSAAEKYEPKWKEYLRTKYKPAKPVSQRIMESASIIPRLKVGTSFANAPLGHSKDGAKAPASKPASPPRPKVDPGEALMKKAALLESGKDYLSAIDLYQQVVQMGKASRHADEAAEKVKKFLSDGDIAAEYDKVLKERQLDSDLAMADSYMAAGHYDKVVECCEKVISAAPDSKQARAAKELLEEAKRAQDSGR